MKVVLGLYTTLYSAPQALFDRTLSLVYDPVLSYLYSKPGNHIALYQSSQMIKYIKRERKEYKSLIALYTKQGDIEHLSGVWNESFLSLLPPKDRLGQIEKLTSEIRHEYGVLPKSAFFYGEVWQPYYISLMNNAGIDNLVMSTFSPVSGEGEESPFMMSEIGKRVNIYPFSDSASSAVRDYADGRIDYQTLRAKLLAEIHSREDGIIFLNVDQLVLGAVREGKDMRPGEIVCDILERVQTVPLSSIEVRKSSYLPQGWYSRDSEVYSLLTPNSLFVRNANYRYLYNRYISIAENLQQRSNRFLKKDVTTSLFNTSIGNIFNYDSECAPLRYSVHSDFWHAVIDAENCFLRDTDSPSMRECDYEESGYCDYVMSSKGSYLAVVSPLGASCAEFDYLPLGINYFDTRPDVSGSDCSSPLSKSFEDTITLGDTSFSTKDILFDSEILDKKRSEIVFSHSESSLPFIISKRYKMKANTFTLDTTITSSGARKLSGSYSLTVYISFPDAVLLMPEQKMDMVAKGRVEAKTVKYISRDGGSAISVSSTESFVLTEETVSTQRITALGREDFVLSRKITFTFPLEAGEDESVTYRLNLRDISNKQ